MHRRSSARSARSWRPTSWRVIAAGVLYVTAVSSVRGFALTLGCRHVLDLFVVYFFKRPTMFLIARSPRLVRMPGFGLEERRGRRPRRAGGRL